MNIVRRQDDAVAPCLAENAERYYAPSQTQRTAELLLLAVGSLFVPYPTTILMLSKTYGEVISYRFHSA